MMLSYWEHYDKKNSGKKTTEGFGPYLDLLKNWKIGILGQLRGLTQQ